MAVNSPRADDYRVSHIPLDWPEEREHRRKIAEGAEQALEGKIRSTGTVTLGSLSTTTTLTDPRIGPQSFIEMMPTTSNAATAKKNGIHFDTFADGSCVINHGNSPNTDQTFVYVILG